MSGKYFALIIGSCFAILATVAAILFVFVQSPCGDPDPGCVREWFSSVGSWVGSIATIATLSFLLDQHRQLTAASRRPNLILCDSIQANYDETTKPMISGLAASISFLNVPTLRHLELEDCRQSLMRLQSLLASSSHDDFSRTIQDVSQPLMRARENLAEALQEIKVYGGREMENLPLEAVQNAFNKMSAAFTAARMYRDQVSAALLKYKVGTL